MMLHMNLERLGFLQLKNRHPILHTHRFWPRYTDAPVICSPSLCSLTEHLGLTQDPKFLTPCGSREKNYRKNASTLVIIRLVSTDWMMSAFC